MNKIIYFKIKGLAVWLLVIPTCLSLLGCDDFLSEQPKHELVESNAVTNYSGAQNILNGIYANYRSASYLGGNLYGSLASRAGLYNYYTLEYGMSYSQTNMNTPSYIWNNLYNVINCANAAVSGIETLDVNEFPSEAVKNQMLGEARCMRGFFNLNLLWNFARWFDESDSPYGILYREKVSNLSNLMVDRVTVGESYQLVLDDLEFAEQYAPDFTTSRYASKQFAQVLHAKLLLNRGWDGDYQEALKIVNNVMQTAPSSWKMEPNVSKLYEDAWDSPEVLFSRYIGKDDLTGTVASMEPFYCYSIYQADGVYPIPNEWVTKDPRYEYTFGTAYGPENWQSTIEKDNVCTKLYHGGRALDPDAKYCTYVFRYAELYLMKAELLARTNPSDIQGALKPLNEMRANYTTPKLDPISVGSYEELMDAIYKEYVVTLLLENETEWFATIRFTHDGRPWINILKPDVNFTKDQYCWPIPDAEITAHTNKIVQNPGLE